MDKRAGIADQAWQAPHRIPGVRLAPVGAPGADALTWISRVVGLALAIGVAWWIWVAVRPLPAAESEDSAAPPQIPSLPERAVNSPDRAALVESLARENLFAWDRQPWARTALPGLSAPGAGDPEHLTSGGPTADQSATVGVAAGASADGSSSVAFTPSEKLPDDLKKALAALELKAVRAERDGGVVAMISFVHSPTRQQSAPFRPGDEFKDEANPNAMWRVEAVDVVYRRVFLSRGGVTAALPLYKGLGEGPPVAAAAGATSPASGLTVHSRTRDEVVLELRSLGLAESEILAVIEELDRQLDESGESPVKALGKIVAAPDAPADSEARRAPPAGMEAILKMMETQSKQVAMPAEGEDQEKPARGRPPRPRRGN